MIRYLFVMSVLVLFTACSSVKIESTGCRLIPTELSGTKGYILDNGLVKVSVFPGLSGKVLDYTFIPTGELLFQPLEEEVIEFVDPPIIISSNHAGYKDMIWEYKLNTAYRIYKGEITKNTPEAVAVRMSWQGQIYRIERTVSLRRGSTALGVEIKLTSLKKKPRMLSYWRQTTANVKDVYKPGKQIVPLRPKPDKMPRYREYKNRKVDYIFKEEAPVRSNNYLPAQPWWAWISPGSKLLMGEVVDNRKSMLPDGFFYSFRRGTLMTQETIFGARKFTCGQSRVYRLAFVAVDGLDDLDYLSANLALNVIKTENGKVTVQAASPKLLSNVELRTALLAGGEVVSVGISVKTDLKPIGAVKLELPLDLKTKPGTYQLAIQLLQSGKVAETAQIMEQIIKVGK